MELDNIVTDTKLVDPNLSLSCEPNISSEMFYTIRIFCQGSTEKKPAVNLQQKDFRQYSSAI